MKPALLFPSSHLTPLLIDPLRRSLFSPCCSSLCCVGGLLLTLRFCILSFHQRERFLPLQDQPTPPLLPAKVPVSGVSYPPCQPPLQRYCRSLFYTLQVVPHESRLVTRFRRYLPEKVLPSLTCESTYLFYAVILLRSFIYFEVFLPSAFEWSLWLIFPVFYPIFLLKLSSVFGLSKYGSVAFFSFTVFVDRSESGSPVTSVVSVLIVPSH